MKSQKETETNVIFKEKEWYRKNIVETTEQINDVWILKAIHNFIAGMTKEGN